MLNTRSFKLKQKRSGNWKNSWLKLFLSLLFISRSNVIWHVDAIWLLWLLKTYKFLQQKKCSGKANTHFGQVHCHERYVNRRFMYGFGEAIKQIFWLLINQSHLPNFSYYLETTQFDRILDSHYHTQTDAVGEVENICDDSSRTNGPYNFHYLMWIESCKILANHH